MSETQEWMVIGFLGIGWLGMCCACVRVAVNGAKAWEVEDEE